MGKTKFAAILTREKKSPSLPSTGPGMPWLLLLVASDAWWSTTTTTPPRRLPAPRASRILSATPPPPVHRAIQTAFDRQDVNATGRISATHVRRALAEVGVDVNARNTRILMRTYAADEDAADVHALSSMIEHSTVASPARMWIALDPDNRSLRRTRLGWNHFGKAGMMTPVRMAHYGTGLASLVLGTADFASYVAHAGVLPLDADTALVHGAVHTAAAILSLPRFRYHRTPSQPWWHLWMRTSREANMWPTAIQYVWYTAAMASDFVLPPDLAHLSTHGAGFEAASWLVAATLLYGTSRTIREVDDIAGVYKTHRANVLQVLANVAVPVLADVGKCLLVSHDAGVHAAYTGLVAGSPAYTQVYLGSLLAGMYIGNVACALSSAEHYRAITKAQIGDLQNAMVALATAAALVGSVSHRRGPPRVGHAGRDLAWGVFVPGVKHGESIVIFFFMWKRVQTILCECATHSSEGRIDGGRSNAYETMRGHMYRSREPLRIGTRCWDP